MQPPREKIAAIFEGERMVLHATKMRSMLSDPALGPLSADFTLSDSCQHKCPFCVDDRNEVSGPVMKKEDIERILHELAAAGVGSVNFEGGGEPMVNKHFDFAVERAETLGMHVGVITNGGLLGKETNLLAVANHTHYVRVSLDAHCADMHELKHGVKGDFAKICNAIEQLVTLRDADTDSLLPIIGIGYLLDEDTVAHMADVLELAEGLGVDYVSFRPVHDEKKYGGFYLRNDAKHAEAFARLDEVASTSRCYVAIDFPTTPYEPTQQCYAHRAKITVGADGTVYTCCNKRYLDDYSLGKLTPDVPLEQLWSGKKRRSVMSRIENPLQDMRRHCTSCNSDALNRAFREMVHPGLHHRFLG